MVILYIIFGIIGGLLGGMGMGGGTLLIPLLTIGLSVPQQTAQFINLVAFIPMSALALIVHIRNGYVVKKRIFYVSYNKMIEIMRVLEKVYKSIKIGWILLTGKQKV